MATATDWVALQSEYVNGTMSQDDLAKKYGIKPRQISTHSIKEGWVELRHKQREINAEKLRQKAGDEMVRAEAARLARINDIGNRLLDKVERAASEEMNLIVVRNREYQRVSKVEKDGTRKEQSKTFEHVGTEKSIVDMTRVSQIARALKDIAEITALTNPKNVNESAEFDRLLKIIEAGADDV